MLCKLQVRFALKFLSGEKKLPTKDEMMQDSLANAKVHWMNGYPKSKTHYLIPIQDDCQRQLATTADIENIPDVYLKINSDILNSLINHPTEFRNFKYFIVDECNFTKIKRHE